MALQISCKQGHNMIKIGQGKGPASTILWISQIVVALGVPRYQKLIASPVWDLSLYTPAVTKSLVIESL